MAACNAEAIQVSVKVFWGVKELSTSTYTVLPTQLYKDLIQNVADNNAEVLAERVLLEHVPDKSTSAGVKVLQHTDFINANYTTLHMQTALRKRLQIRAMPMLNADTTLEKVTRILFASLTLTDGLVLLVGAARVTPSFAVFEFYAEFESPRLLHTIKTYFENYFGVASINPATATHLKSVGELPFSVTCDNVKKSPYVKLDNAGVMDKLRRLKTVEWDRV